MIMICFLKIILFIGWRLDWRGIRDDVKILVFQERVDSGLNLYQGSEYGCEVKWVNLRYIQKVLYLQYLRC